MNEIKCIVWDLDNTLWDGILSEDISVKLKDDIIDVIKTLDLRGILHSISSKNDFQPAADKLREFGLLEYFLYPEINWNNKSISVKKISENLNIGLESIMFIDDQQFERAEVNFSLPEVICFDASDYKLLPDYPALNPRFITESSKLRRKLYLEDITRKNLEESFSGPKEEFLKSLKMELKIKQAEENDLRRLEELTQRTHQLNTTGVTYDYDDLKNLLASDNHILLTAELNDTFGSYGNIGLVVIQKLNQEWRIKLFILSCRVMNRGIGTILLNEIIKAARSSSRKLTAEFLQTEKNRIMYITLKFANFIELDEQNEDSMLILYNDLSIINQKPHFINLLAENEWI
jgi:FkbH-like protein